ncbi:uncharacterized protein LOC100908302 [Galendromus occidentalis]|uniref:Uncharacterized protein LOC100908302 n=1 Tax=Galendromus occidentalis TaxID=34638 RepID=A0AAJ6VWU3_9ACAR|nr:uncharacterized protein LOC100908302 [Galendromus occidentalis]
MSANQLKPGNRVLVTTDSLCQYEGFFRAVNRSNGTFTLTKVRSLGSKDGSFRASNKVYDCVEFVAAEVVNFLALDDGEDGMRSDPAIVSVTGGWPSDGFNGRRQPYPHVRRSNSHYNTPFARSRFQRDFKNDNYRSENTHNSFRSERSAAPQRNFRAPQGNNYWSQFTSRSPLQREGSFPQKFPGQKKPIGEYDIDKGLEEFSRLKLDGEGETLKQDKGYNKEISFFDTLTVDAGDHLKQSEPRQVSPRKAAHIDQNVVTFGEDTVRSLNFLRKTSYNPAPFRVGGYNGGRHAYASGGFQPQRRFMQSRGTMRGNYL